MFFMKQADTGSSFSTLVRDSLVWALSFGYVVGAPQEPWEPGGGSESDSNPVSKAWRDQALHWRKTGGEINQNTIVNLQVWHPKPPVGKGFI
jgi:hypothetical protein